MFDRTPFDRENPHGKILLAPQLTGRSVDCACPGCEKKTVPFRVRGGFFAVWRTRWLESTDHATRCRVVATRMELADARGWQLRRERLARPADVALLLREMEYARSEGFALNMDMFWRVSTVLRFT